MDFVSDWVSLLYFIYLRPSRLRDWLEQETGVRGGYFVAVFEVHKSSGARRIVLAYTLWLVVGMAPLWVLGWSSLPWQTVVAVGAGLLLVCSFLALFDLSFGLMVCVVYAAFFALAPSALSGAGSGLEPLRSFVQSNQIWTVAGVCFLMTAVYGAFLGANARSSHHGVWTELTQFFRFAVSPSSDGTFGWSATFFAFLVLAGIVEFVRSGLQAGWDSALPTLGQDAVIVAAAVAGAVAGFVGGAYFTYVLLSVPSGMIAVFTSLVLVWPLRVGAFDLSISEAIAIACVAGLLVSPRPRPLVFGIYTVFLVFVSVLSIGPNATPPDPQIALFEVIGFAVGYFRLPLYVVELAGVGWGLMRLNGTPERAKEVLRRQPPFTDEIVWLHLFGLNRLLAAAIKADAEDGEAEEIAASFRQGWAARAAWLQISSEALAGYGSLEQLPNAEREFIWVPPSPDRSLRNVAALRGLVDRVGADVRQALNATNNYLRLVGLNRAQSSLKDVSKFFAGLPARDEARRFAPIVSTWEGLVDAEIARLSQDKKTEVDIPQPYVVGTPVPIEYATLFAARTDLVLALEQSLGALHDRPALFLYGARRMGKSSFINQLPRLLGPDVIPIKYDLQQATDLQGLAGLYFDWTNTACKESQVTRGVDLPHYDFAQFNVEPGLVWRQWLDAAVGAAKTKKLFFVFDEFERLAEKANDVPQFRSAFDGLRHLIQHSERIHFLFAGSHRLDSMAPGGRYHDYFINVKMLEVAYLDEHEARRLLTAPMPDFPVTFAPGTIDEVVRLTRCQPFLVQLTGQGLVERLNSEQRRAQGDWHTVTFNDVAEVAEQIPQAGRGYFVNLWSETAAQEKCSLRPVLAAPDGCTLEDVAAATPEVSAHAVAAALNSLEQARIVEQIDGRWRVQVELTRRALVELGRRGALPAA